MDILKDKIHHCDTCDKFPCSFQDDISKNDICKECPVPCCRCVVVPILPCEEGKYEAGKFGGLKMNTDGWCHYYGHNIGCTIYDIRPVTCRIASCRFIREGKMPDELKLIVKRRSIINRKKKV